MTRLGTRGHEGERNHRSRARRGSSAPCMHEFRPESAGRNCGHPRLLLYRRSAHVGVDRRSVCHRGRAGKRSTPLRPSLRGQHHPRRRLLGRGIRAQRCLRSVGARVRVRTPSAVLRYRNWTAQRRGLSLRCRHVVLLVDQELAGRGDLRRVQRRWRSPGGRRSPLARVALAFRLVACTRSRAQRLPLNPTTNSPYGTSHTTGCARRCPS